MGIHQSLQSDLQLVKSAAIEAYFLFQLPHPQTILFTFSFDTFEFLLCLNIKILFYWTVLPMMIVAVVLLITIFLTV